MLITWFTRLWAKFVRRVLRLRMPSLFDSIFNARISMSIMDPNPTLVLYIGARRFSDSDSDDALSRARIQTVRLKKSPGQGIFERVYILVEVISGNGSWANDSVIGELMVERTTDPDTPAMDPATPATVDPATPSGSSDSLSPVPKDYPIMGRDRITFNPDYTDADTTVFQYTFDEVSAPSLLNLLVAADLLNLHVPNYILMERQCYWFSGMLLYILLGDATSDLPVRPGAAQRTPFSLAFKRSPREGPQADLPTEPVLAGQAGTFKNLFQIVTNRNIDSLYDSEIKQEYELRQAEVGELLEEARACVARRRAETALVKLAAQAHELDEAIQKALQEIAQAKEEGTRARARAALMREEAKRAREGTARTRKEATRAREGALQEESARMREELSRLEAAATERHGDPPHAQ
ncbi:hypothetical protein VTO73DRAFT_10812 [Trametes versicolor]